MPPGRSASFFRFLQAEAVVISAAVVFTATVQAGDTLTKRAHPFHFDLALRTAVEVLSSDLPSRERQAVASLFTRQTQFRTGSFPLGTVRSDPAPTCPEFRDEMREFMPQRNVDFGRAEIGEPWIQRDLPELIRRHAGSTAESGIPADFHAVREITATDGNQHEFRALLEIPVRFAGR